MRTTELEASARGKPPAATPLNRYTGPVPVTVWQPRPPAPGLLVHDGTCVRNAME